MPIIEARREGLCSACGSLVRKGETVHFTAELGVQHADKRCAGQPATHRPNRRAARCACGSVVPAGKGVLVLASESSSFKKTWRVRCTSC